MKCWTNWPHSSSQLLNSAGAKAELGLEELAAGFAYRRFTIFSLSELALTNNLVPVRRVNGQPYLDCHFRYPYICFYAKMAARSPCAASNANKVFSYSS